MSRAGPLALALVGLLACLAHARAEAQAEGDPPAEPGRAEALAEAPAMVAAQPQAGEGLARPYLTGERDEPEFGMLDWPTIPAGALNGVRNPVAATQADHGLVYLGAIWTGVAYLSTVALTFSFALTFCSYSCQEGYATLSLLPLGASSLAGYVGGSAASAVIITAGVGGALELIGLVILLAGALHSRPVMVPRAGRPTGESPFRIAF